MTPSTYCWKHYVRVVYHIDGTPLGLRRPCSHAVWAKKRMERGYPVYIPAQLKHTGLGKFDGAAELPFCTDPPIFLSPIGKRLLRK